jgi:hypothetical protein
MSDLIIGSDQELDKTLEAMSDDAFVKYMDSAQDDDFYNYIKIMSNKNYGRWTSIKHLSEKRKTSWWGGYSTTFEFCNKKHIRQEVILGDYTISASAGMDAPSPINKPYPDFGVYLDISWLNRVDFGCSLHGVSMKYKYYLYPNIIINWPDFGVVQKSILNEVSDIIISKLKDNKSVDIGCSAGHGRTGTMLAVLLGKIENINGDEAIKKIRKVYCDKAIESKTQIDLIKEMLG